MNISAAAGCLEVVKKRRLCKPRSSESIGIGIGMGVRKMGAVIIGAGVFVGCQGIGVLVGAFGLGVEVGVTEPIGFQVGTGILVGWGDRFGVPFGVGVIVGKIIGGCHVLGVLVGGTAGCGLG
jgi:hypothetical protein